MSWFHSKETEPPFLSVRDKRRGQRIGRRGAVAGKIRTIEEKPGPAEHALVRSAQGVAGEVGEMGSQGLPAHLS
jgi:hypothetical protein